VLKQHLKQSNRRRKIDRTYPPVEITFIGEYQIALIVEENPMFLKFYSERLSLPGFSFFASNSYKEAPNFFIVARPKLVILGSSANEAQRLNFAREIAELESKCKTVLLWPKLELSREISQDRFVEDLMALT
jgi:hypothetical protein